MNTYTKLQSGEWGVRAAGKVASGASVIVNKKDGSTKTETVEKVLWTGKDKRTSETISLCAIRAERRNGEPRGRDVYGSYESRSNRRRVAAGEMCSCHQCQSGSECLCIYGNG